MRLIYAADSIHAKWLMDENAKIFRVEICLRPPKAPIIAEAMIKINNRINGVGISKQKRIRIKGASFCQKRMIQILIHFKPSVTWGTQKWKGALPILIKSLMKTKVMKMFRWFILLWEKLYQKMEAIRIDEASAWIRKYFKEASEFRGDLLLRRIANKAIMLTSKLIQVAIQDGDEIADNDPRIKIK